MVNLSASLINPTHILCRLPILKRFLCPLIGSSSSLVRTPIGAASGTLDPSGVNRFTVQYATAHRWQESQVATTWNLAVGALNETDLPLACPQPDVDPSTYTENCLSMILYVPPSLPDRAPTFLWIHGGSFIVGSATDAGLDGSKLAIATKSIVAVIQYRLGALGFMVPNGNTNLAIKDVIASMQFLRLVLPSFGGDASKITLAGQSSGANMIRALLAVPSASSLFTSAILHSDPMNYGFLSTTAQGKLQATYNDLISCSSTNTTCWDSLSIDTILSAQTTLYNTAASIDPSAGPAQPIRPVNDDSLIGTSFNSAPSFQKTEKPIIVSTVLNEAGPAIYGQFTAPLSEDAFQPICEASLGSSRTSTILASPFYKAQFLANGSVDARTQLQSLGTDQVWKCAAWTFVRNWVQSSSTAYVGLYTVGASYPSNNGIPFCAQSESVCHQDDIRIVFGTVDSPTTQQSALISEVQKRYRAFLYTGSPNIPGLPIWPQANSSFINAYNFGGRGEIPIGACQTDFWGQTVPYDYQVYA
ncbi:hypothetical protein AMATHDRAFT_524 [Amanita thiersii Skay4041]|uniref:Carboxylic ester hydrolase n=1 Tax=Amanita thiersii Skay4041 TaxID=703135 RepID=A0A2A9NUM8_9AGAR|nr:hypothetical protein AMATHDRAFT_524 [Amanita thiersii Skay4041]